MWRLISSISNRGFRSVRLSQCCSQDSPDEKTRCYWYTPCRWFHDRLQNSVSYGADNSSKNEAENSDPASNLGKQGKYAEQRLPDQKNLGILCNVNFKDNQKRWGRSYHWKNRERFLLTHSILQGLGLGSAVAVTWSLLKSLNDLRRERDARTSVHKWHNERNIWQRQNEQIWGKYDGDTSSDNKFDYTYINPWWLQHGQHYPPVDAQHQTGAQNIFINVSSQLFTVLPKLVVNHQELASSFKNYVIDSTTQKNIQLPSHQTTQHYTESQVISSIEQTSDEELLQTPSYIEEHLLDSLQNIQESNVSHTPVIKAPVNNSKVKDVGGKLYYADSKTIQKDLNETDSGHSSFTNRETVQQQKTHTGIEEFDEGLNKILNDGIEDIKALQGEFKEAMEEDIQSFGSDSPGAAVVYFQVGTMLGDADSTFNLALCHHFGRGVEQDMKKARSLYETASEKGHGEATYNLAILVSQGQGGPANVTQARKLIALAAERGVKEAQEALREIAEEEIIQEGSILSRTQSEPSLSSVPSCNWSSSYSTSDLDLLDDSLGFVSTEINIRRRPTFYLD